MASVLNKRQQARNERALQELIKTVPGNSVCADCGARNPGWASWSVGVFLCLRCAAIHRKLGTHISKVKSLSMDKWDNAQVDNMKRVGNVESNKLYNPRNVKPQIPIDVDEVDSVMERFVRQKYEQRVFMSESRPGTRSNTGSSSSVEDRPPPLPPKPTKRFGFGIQKSNTFSGHVTPPTSPGRRVFNSYDQSPPMINKPSRVFGSNISTSGDGLDSKLATLRDMGFHDEKRNSTVLKSLNGNLDKAVEALIRLGETARSRASTPTPPANGPNGLSFERTQTAPAGSMNPFEALDAMPQQQLPQLQTQLNPYGGAMTQPASPANSYNPFLSGGQPGMQQNQQHYQQQQSAHQSNPFGIPQGLEQSFQGMQISNQQPQQLQQPQQPLFPNRTGGYGQVSSSFVQSNPFAQSFTPPPMAQTAQQYGSNYQFQNQQQQPPLSSPTSPGNPFLKSSRSQMLTQATATNPFGQSLQQQQQPQQIQQQGQNPFLMQQQQFSQVHSPLVQAPNPFDTQQQQHQSYLQQSQQNPYQQSYQQQPQQAQNYQQNQTQKNSILALYNYPQLAPQRPEQLQTPPPAAQQTATSQVQSTGQMNPFAAATQGALQQQQVASAIPPQVQNGTRHVSNESVDFAGLMGGRHSPDAFSGLSSSFRR